MSKRKSFGRFTAMSLAGISAVSSMAIVAYADAYPTTVYEFTYKGIASTALSASAQRSLGGNGYVTSTEAAGVFEDGFKVTNLEVFGFDAAYASNYVDLLNSDGGATWVYKNAKAFTGTTTPVIAEDYILSRKDGSVITEEAFYFKTKAERDSALSLIATKNKTEYTSKYNLAYAALKSELAKIADAHKAEEEKAAKAGKDAMYQDYKDKVITKEEYDTYVKEVYNVAMDAAKKNHDDRDDLAVVILKEFAEAYAPANRGFSHSEPKNSIDKDYAVFYVDDSDPYVEISGIAGSTYQTASYDSTATGNALSLEYCKYRTQGTYQDEDSYAFKGEIIESSILSALSNHGAYLVAGDYWQQFSSSFQGSNSNNANSSDSSETTENKKEDTTWLPESASYRIPNTANVSYKGENNYWYTSSAAAEVYGGGYSGTTMTSNYNAVKDSKNVYFCALDGRYYSSVTSFSYLVATNKEEETTTQQNVYTDPYYYYFLMNQNNAGTTTTIDPSAPTIYGSTKRSCWNKILSAVKSVKNGTVTIDMNAATTIPSEVVKAAAANGVTLKAVNENGSIFTINGKDVSYATSIDTTVAYNVRVVSDNLKKKAISVNKGAISTTQLAISTDGSLGTDATVTVKLSSKRAGCTVKAYRASNNGKKLTLEAKGTVKSNGSVSLNLDNGGKYVLVIIE